MCYLSLVLPCFSATVAQPQRCGANIWRHVLTIRRVNWRGRVGRHEDFDGLVRVADGPIVETALNAVVASILACLKRLTESVVRLRPSVNAANVHLEEVGKLNVRRAKAAKLFRLRYELGAKVCRPTFWLRAFRLRRRLSENTTRGELSRLLCLAFAARVRTLAPSL